MGRTGLFSYIVNKFSQVLSVLYSPEPVRSPLVPIVTDYLSIDSNYIIWQEIFPKGASLPNTDNIETILDDIVKKFEKLVFQVKPVRGLFISLDGTAPCAKPRNAPSAPAPAGTTKEMISPGTTLMKLFLDRLICKIRTLKATKGSEWENLDVIISPSTIPGEGEQKIAQHIHLQLASIEGYESLNHAIYSHDGDIFLLALGIPVNNLNIIGEGLIYTKDLSAIDVGQLRSELCSKLQSSTTHNWAVCVIVFGNDFLPYHLKFNEANMQLVIDIHKRMEQNATHWPIISPEGIIQFVNFQEFLREIESVSEKSRLESAYKTAQEKQNPTKKGRGSKYKAVPDFAELRKVFYELRFNLDRNSPSFEQDVTNICIRYFETIYWIARYDSIEGCPSWTHSYAYKSAPLLSDLNKIKESDFTKPYDDSPPLVDVPRFEAAEGIVLSDLSTTDKELMIAAITNGELIYL